MGTKSLKSVVKISLTSILSILAIYLLLSQIELSSIPEVLTSIHPINLIVSWVLYAFFVFVKAYRFRIIISQNTKVPEQSTISMMRLYSIISIHTFWSNLLPMRTGDLSYVYLMKTRGDVSGVKSISSLIIASVIDILLLMLTMMISGFLLRTRLNRTLSSIILFALPLIISSFLVGLIIAMFIFPEHLSRFFDKISKLLHVDKNRVFLWIYSKFKQILQEFTNISLNLRFIKIIWASIAVIFLRFGIQCYLIKAMDLQIGILPIIFALAFTGFCNIFPIQTVGSIGAVEAPWTLALISFSVTKEAAIISGFSLHIIILIYCALMGLYGFVTDFSR